MPFINIPKTVLEKLLIWDHPKTFFELYPINNVVWVFLFACHFGHLDHRTKIDLHEFFQEYG